MKFKRRNQAFLLWGVISVCLLVLQAKYFIDDYHNEIDKQEQLSYLNAENLANEMEAILETEVARLHQVSNIISHRILHFTQQDHVSNQLPSHNDSARHVQHHLKQDTKKDGEQHIVHRYAKDWIKQTNEYLYSNFNISIRYVVEDEQHVLYDENDELNKARYKQWLEELEGNFAWQFVFEKDSQQIQFYTVNRFKDSYGHTYKAIIEFIERVQSIPAFSEQHHLFLINRSGIAFNVTQDDFKPIILSLPTQVGINSDLDFIEKHFGLRPEIHQKVAIDFTEKFGKRLAYLNQNGETEFFYNTFYFKSLKWRFLVLSDAKSLSKGVTGEYEELLLQLLFLITIIIAIGFVIHYHFKVSSLLMHDSLTQLFNRNHFKRKSKELSNLQKRNKKQKIGVVAIDIDHFKAVNDTFGHAVGDKVLKHLAKLMEKHTRTTDFVYRFGGEEFLILIPGEGIEDSRALAERLRLEVEQDKSIVKLLPKGYTISLGVTEKQASETMEQAIIRADALLYQAKNAGRNQVVTGQYVVSGS